MLIVVAGMNYAFQFQYGTIEVGFEPVPGSRYPAFQFQYGTIEVHELATVLGVADRFQFQYGTIEVDKQDKTTTKAQ